MSDTNLSILMRRVSADSNVSLDGARRTVVADDSAALERIETLLELLSRKVRISGLTGNKREGSFLYRSLQH